MTHLGGGLAPPCIMTNLTRLRLILVDLSGLMKKKTYLKQNVLFVNPFPSDFFP